MKEFFKGVIKSLNPQGKATGILVSDSFPDQEVVFSLNAGREFTVYNSVRVDFSPAKAVDAPQVGDIVMFAVFPSTAGVRVDRWGFKESYEAAHKRLKRWRICNSLGAVLWEGMNLEDPYIETIYKLQGVYWEVSFDSGTHWERSQPPSDYRR